MNITEQLAVALRSILTDYCVATEQNDDHVATLAREALAAYDSHKQTPFSDDDSFESGYGG